MSAIDELRNKDAVDVTSVEVADIDRITGELQPEDLAKLKQIDVDPAKVFWFESKPEDYVPLTDSQIEEFAKTTDDHLLFIVRGSGLLEGAEKGEIQGWLKVNPDDPSRIAQLVEQGVVKDPDNALVLEVSYTAVKGAPSHQMSSALRKLCYSYGEAFKQFDEPIQEVIITAYVQDKLDPKTGEQNVGSMRVLQSCGFEERGGIQYDELAETPDHLFVLNWDLLVEKIRSRLGNLEDYSRDIILQV